MYFLTCFSFMCGCKSDGYKRTGCYNLDCSGFVQVSRKYSVGAALSPFSHYNAKQYEVYLVIYKVMQKFTFPR